MSRRQRSAVGGTILVLHGLAHASPGMQVAAGTYAPWLRELGIANVLLLRTATLLWSVAMSGFVAAGFGCSGAVAFRRYWRGLATAAAVASLALLLAWPTVWTIPGLAVDLAVLVRVRPWDAWSCRIIDASRALAADRGGDL